MRTTQFYATQVKKLRRDWGEVKSVLVAQVTKVRSTHSIAFKITKVTNISCKSVNLIYEAYAYIVYGFSSGCSISAC
jgi:hypothetical protein